MKISVSTILCSVLLILVVQGAIISNLDSKGAANNFTINIQNNGSLQLALPIYCRTGSVLSSQFLFSNVYQLSLMVDPNTNKSDCFGVIRLNQSTDYAVYFRTFLGTHKVMEYDFELLTSGQSSGTLYTLTSTRNVSNKYRETEAAAPVECVYPPYVHNNFYNLPCWTSTTFLSDVMSGITETNMWIAKFSLQDDLFEATNVGDPDAYEFTPEGDGLLTNEDVFQAINNA